MQIVITRSGNSGHHEQTRCYVTQNCVFDIRRKKSNKTKFTLWCPKFFILKSVLQSWLDEDFTIAEIAKLLCVSESTVYRRMQEYNLSKLAFTDISDQELDDKVNIKMFKIQKGSFRVCLRVLHFEGCFCILFFPTIFSPPSTPPPRSPLQLETSTNYHLKKCIKPFACIVILYNIIIDNYCTIW